ncbi:MAG TPA: HEAT repeat domain-containing protein [Candidatus Brocadiia bacterium]|nr:HEAT repeat domain-containing protein [Candidatus Brocadiia bacterium]
MDSEQLEKCVKDLYSVKPLIGIVIRRGACKKLAEDGSAETVPYLIEAVRSDDKEMKATAWEGLCGLRAPDAVDALCRIWFGNRDETLGNAIVQGHFVARTPIEVHIATVFKNGGKALLDEYPSECVELAANFLLDDDLELSARAADSLASVKDQSRVDKVCEMAIANPQGIVADIARKKEFQPSSHSRTCLLMLLTGRVHHCIELDPEFRSLRAEYHAANEGLRKQIRETIAASGNEHLATLIRDVKRQKLAAKLTELETDIIIASLKARGQTAPLLPMLFHIPLSRVASAVDAIAGSGWKPATDAEGRLLAELQNLRPMIAEVPEAPPGAGAGFGCVIDGWIERGRSKEFTSKDDNTLRETLSLSPPPEAVAAMSALLATDKISPDEVETVRNHPHWLVRLALARITGYAPQFASSGLLAKGGGGRAWTERLGAPLLHAALYKSRAVNLSQGQLKILQQVLARPNPDAEMERHWGQTLEVLARHRYSGTVQVNESMSVSFLEKAIEVEEW